MRSTRPMFRRTVYVRGRELHPCALICGSKCFNRSEIRRKVSSSIEALEPFLSWTRGVQRRCKALSTSSRGISVSSGFRVPAKKPENIATHSPNWNAFITNMRKIARWLEGWMVSWLVEDIVSWEWSAQPCDPPTLPAGCSLEPGMVPGVHVAMH